jgi:hypothetical protein
MILKRPANSNDSGLFRIPGISDERLDLNHHGLIDAGVPLYFALVEMS